MYVIQKFLLICNLKFGTCAVGAVYCNIDKRYAYQDDEKVTLFYDLIYDEVELRWMDSMCIEEDLYAQQCGKDARAQHNRHCDRLIRYTATTLPRYAAVSKYAKTHHNLPHICVQAYLHVKRARRPLVASRRFYRVIFLSFFFFSPPFSIIISRDSSKFYHFRFQRDVKVSFFFQDHIGFMSAG